MEHAQQIILRAFTRQTVLDYYRSNIIQFYVPMISVEKAITEFQDDLKSVQKIIGTLDAEYNATGQKEAHIARLPMPSSKLAGYRNDAIDRLLRVCGTMGIKELLEKSGEIKNFSLRQLLSTLVSPRLFESNFNIDHVCIACEYALWVSARDMKYGQIGGIAHQFEDLEEKK